MKNNISNSKLLDHLYERAEKIKNKKGHNILTINHIFAAVLELVADCPGDFSKYGNQSEGKAVFDLVADIVMSDTISSYIDFLCAKKGTYIDDLIFKQAQASAKYISEKNGKSEITADILLKCIIDAPSDEISEIKIGRAHV